MKLEHMTDLATLWDEAVASTHSGCTTSLCNAYAWVVEVQTVIYDVCQCSPKELCRQVAVWRNLGNNSQEVGL